MFQTAHAPLLPAMAEKAKCLATREANTPARRILRKAYAATEVALEISRAPASKLAPHSIRLRTNYNGNRTIIRHETAERPDHLQIMFKKRRSYNLLPEFNEIVHSRLGYRLGAIPLGLYQAWITEALGGGTHAKKPTTNRQSNRKSIRCPGSVGLGQQRRASRRECASAMRAMGTTRGPRPKA